MNKTEEIAAQTDLRRRMLANGYVPLANKDKMCVLKGWPDLHVDAAQIDAWSQQLKWRGTGVRIEGGLVAIDLDVNDDDALDAIVDAIPAEIWSILQDAPVRRGKGAKEAWFCRLADGEEPFYRLASAGFRQAAGDETVHRVEVFAGEGGGRQFGAYGAHTIDEHGNVAVQYYWAGDIGLADVHFNHLPRLTRAQLVTIADTATRVLDELGWQRDVRSKPGFSSPTPIYDLDAQDFETRDHGTMGLADLEALCELHGTIRLSASWLEGAAAVNMTRCIASIHPRDGRLSILETASYETHRPAALAPRPIPQGALDRLQQLAAGSTLFGGVAPAAVAPTAAEVGVEMADDMGLVVDALLQEYVFMATEQKCVVPLTEGMEGAMTLANFRVKYKMHAVTVTGPRGGTSTIHPVDLWQADPRRIDALGYRFRPDVPTPLVEQDGKVYVNLYAAPKWVDVDAATSASVVGAFEALLAHLVPDQGTRDWFRMWLASKVQRPQAANCGVLLIAEQQGTGRGTLFDMMKSVLGADYCQTITSTELLGTGGQGVYTDWAAQALLVTVEEVMAGGDSGTNMGWKRREAYERIKQLVDPRQRSMRIRQKGIQNYTQDVFFSLLMATNHLDALPLERNDRRIAVIIQPEVRFEDVGHLRALVNAWRDGGPFGEVFGTALRQHLMAVAVDFAALRIAPELGGGREVMREANEGDLEDILRAVLAKVPGDYILNRDLKRRMQNAVTAEGEGEHLKNWWVRVQDMLKRTNTFGWRAMQTRQSYSGSDGSVQKGVIYYREAAGVAVWQAATLDARGAGLLAPAADVNRVLTAAAEALRDGRLAVVAGPMERD